MPRDIVVIGASAGGLQALTTLVGRLPMRLAASVFVVLHTHAEADGLVPQILSRVSKLPVAFAVDRLTPSRGHVYVAPADLHLTLDASGMRVLRGPRENGFRPAIDPLFRTAARTFGPRVIGVILSGALDDGTYGLSVIKQYGGIAIVQSPEDAIIPTMPRSAIEHVQVDHVLRAAAIADQIARLSTEGAKGGRTMVRRSDLEPQQPTEETAVGTMEQLYGGPSPLTCPDCGGALWEIHDGQVLRYQCHVGHLYAPESLQAEQRDAVDSALWTAVRVLEEHAELKVRMARRAAAEGLETVAHGFEEGARDAHRQAQELRALLFASGNGGGNGSRLAEAASEAATAADAAPRKRKARGSRRTATRRSGSRTRNRPS